MNKSKKLWYILTPLSIAIVASGLILSSSPEIIDNESGTIADNTHLTTNPSLNPETISTQEIEFSNTQTEKTKNKSLKIDPIKLQNLIDSIKVAENISTLTTERLIQEENRINSYLIEYNIIERYRNEIFSAEESKEIVEVIRYLSDLQFAIHSRNNNNAPKDFSKSQDKESVELVKQPELIELKNSDNTNHVGFDN